jgi:hypothetical protein
MTALIGVFGLLIGGFSLVGVVKPDTLMGLITGLPSERRMLLAIVSRIVLGLVLLFGAPATLHPGLVRAVGLFALFAAFALPVIGRERADRYIAWWADRPASFIRVWCLSGVAFGGWLIYTVG